LEELATSGVRIVLATARGPQAVGLIAGSIEFLGPVSRTRDEIYRLIDSQLKDAHPLLEIEWR
jgi:hypothetical protein